MQASLPMYCRPELADAHDRFWSAIRLNMLEAGIDCPEALTPNGDGKDFWLSPDLVFSQTCGLPFRTVLRDKVALIGTPDHGLEGCPSGYYQSCIVVRSGDDRTDLKSFFDATFAFNARDSQSGYAALISHFSDHGISISKLHETGAHRSSAEAVASGEADLAALDAVSWKLMLRHDGFSKGLRVLTKTKPTPGLPYITALGSDCDAMFTAVARAIEQLNAEDREALSLRGLVKIPKEDYYAIETTE